MTEEQRTKNRSECRKGHRRRSQPGAIDLGGTESLADILGDEAKSRSLSTEHPTD